MAMIDTPEGIQAYRMLTLHQGLRLECKGMRLTRGRTCYAIIKDEFGLKGSKENVLRQFEEILQERGM